MNNEDKILKETLIRQAEGKIKVPKTPIKGSHWKVGDKIDSPDPFIIGQIAIIQGKEKDTLTIRYFDANGKAKGDQSVKLIPKNK
jgi:hypothetical protein